MELDKKNGSTAAAVDGGHESRGLRSEKHKWVASLEYIFEYILKNEDS